jgi:hypothetical protein
VKGNFGYTRFRIEASSGGVKAFASAMDFKQASKPTTEGK